MSDVILFRVELFDETTQSWAMTNSRVTESGLRSVLKKVLGMNKTKRNDFVARVLTKDAGYIKSENETKQPYSLHCNKVTTGRPVRDVTTGTIYASRNSAARALSVPEKHMAEFFAGKRQDVAGHTFKAYLGAKE